MIMGDCTVQSEQKNKTGVQKVTSTLSWFPEEIAKRFKHKIILLKHFHCYINTGLVKCLLRKDAMKMIINLRKLIYVDGSFNVNRG
jgi:hypothetical protein